MVKHKVSQSLMDVKRVSPRILLVNPGALWKDIDYYFLSMERQSKEDIDGFYNNLRAEIHLKNRNCNKLEDFNGQVGNSKSGYEGVHKVAEVCNQK